MYRQMARTRFLPEKSVRTLRWVAHRNVDLATGVQFSDILSCNDPNQPDINGSTTNLDSAMGWAQLKTWYQQHQVIGAKITVQEVAVSTSTSVPMYIWIDKEAVLMPQQYFTGVDEMLSKRKGMKPKIVGTNSNQHASSDHLRGPMREFFSANKDGTLSDWASPLAAGVPEHPMYWHVSMRGTLDTTNPGSITLKYIIDYIIESRNPIMFAQSDV